MLSPVPSTGQAATDIISELSKFTPEVINDSLEQRHKAIALSKKLTAALEGPVNTATELVFKPFLSIAARIAVGLDLFTPIVARDGTSITSEELARVSGGEQMLISRILRVMASIGFVEQDGLYSWRANETTKAMASPPIAAGHRFVFDALISSAIKAPKYLQEVGWKSPTEPHDGFLQYANQTKYHVFDYLMAQPSLFADFNLFMGNTMGSRNYWCDWYDVKGRLLKDFDHVKGSALLVDVAGGKGHDLQAFHNKYASKVDGKSGDLVLQEMASVIAGIKDGELDTSIKRMEYDFFEPQPVQGARTYFMHHILHDWSDKYCRIILKHLREAMQPGYSKLLIHDLILPDTGAAEFQARFDLTMMTFNSGMERSGREWTVLLENAGFKVTGIFEHFDADGIVEAEVNL
ncbi:sterigmatocystin 8-O-methyltransferase [Dendryphion nanum]|uniref:Sterigmatocystin 8-O-methyltransferase n=1 Tax=Dendryphion nanum TaxID=256645 RepID=A0A9P9DQC6_9PLEO|nr:sterigmatocystin 8-O-methyltransferase [Dendryphion nanum]